MVEKTQTLERAGAEDGWEQVGDAVLLGRPSIGQTVAYIAGLSRGAIPRGTTVRILDNGIALVTYASSQSRTITSYVSDESEEIRLMDEAFGVVRA